MQLHCNFCAGRHSAATKRNCGEVWTDFKRRMYTNCLVGREGSSCSCSVVGDALAKLSLTMVNNGLWNGTSVSHGWPCSDQAFINHGQPWFVKWHLSQPWLPMLWPSFSPTMVDHALAKLSSTMVDHALAKLSSTMVNHGFWNGTSVIHGWPCSG